MVRVWSARKGAAGRGTTGSMLTTSSIGLESDDDDDELAAGAGVGARVGAGVGVCVLSARRIQKDELEEDEYGSE